MIDQEHQENINRISDEYKTLFDEGFIILDTETTDLYGEVIELAIIDSNGSTVFNHKIKPRERKITKTAESIHGITMEMLEGEEYLSFYLDELRDIFAKNKNLVIYNKAFDIECLNVSLNVNDEPEFKFGFKCMDLKIKCAMEDYACYYNQYNDYFWSYTWQKLTTAAERFDFDFTNIKPHEALSDCLMTLHVVKSMAQKKSDRPDLLAKLREQQNTQ